jgi:hypothetical protein
MECTSSAMLQQVHAFGHSHCGRITFRQKLRQLLQRAGDWVPQIATGMDLSSTDQCTCNRCCHQWMLLGALSEASAGNRPLGGLRP